jgi:hypothetical protein
LAVCGLPPFYSWAERYFAWFGEPSEKQHVLVFHLTKLYPKNDEMQIIFDNFYEILGIFWC